MQLPDETLLCVLSLTKSEEKAQTCKGGHPCHLISQFGQVKKQAVICPVWRNSKQDYLWLLYTPKASVSDPYSFDTDLNKLNTDPDPIRIQGFDDQKLENIYKKKILFFKIKNYNLPIPRPPERNLHPSQLFKT